MSLVYRFYVPGTSTHSYFRTQALTNNRAYAPGRAIYSTITCTATRTSTSTSTMLLHVQGVCGAYSILLITSMLKLKTRSCTCGLDQTTNIGPYS